MRFISILFIGTVLILSGCVSDAGIKVAHLQNKNKSMSASVAYGVLEMVEDKPNSYKAFLGEYQVHQSWSNQTFHIEKVVVAEENNKLVIYTYPKNWQTPNHKSEFVSCRIIDNDGEHEFGISFAKQRLFCNGSNNVFKGYSSFNVVTTSSKTYAKSEIPEAFLSAFLPARKISVTTPYLMELNFWDESEPLLAVTKVK